MMDQLRTTILEYLTGRLSADELATHLPDGWELDESGDAAARDATLRAMAVLAEFQRGDRTEPELWSGLRMLLEGPQPTATAAKFKLAPTPGLILKQFAAGCRTPQEAFA